MRRLIAVACCVGRPIPEPVLEGAKHLASAVSVAVQGDRQELAKSRRTSQSIFAILLVHPRRKHAPTTCVDAGGFDGLTAQARNDPPSNLFGEPSTQQHGPGVFNRSGRRIQRLL